MKGLPAETDFIVVGAGTAGLRAAIELASAGRVLLLDKNAPVRSGEGQLPSLSDEEEIILHLQDTLIAGDGLCRAEQVKVLIEEGSKRIEEVLAWGEKLDRSTKLTFESEPSYRHSHVLRAQSGSASDGVLRVLRAKAKSCKNISIAEPLFCSGIVTHQQRVAGVSVITEKGLPETIAASAVLLATGGLGQLYRNTTNLDNATADGIAMASRAGAEISDLEFIQFHPTSLYMKKVPRFLLSLSLLTEGGYLRNIELDRFMGKYHPLAEKAPADLIARAIMHEMEVSRARDPFVYLDLTHLNAARLHKRFPHIYQTCMKHNIDIAEDLVSVRPAAHFCGGGIRTGLDGETNVTGLYAAGESAATGVHGANRFSSNSALEALIYGARAGAAMCEELGARHCPANVERQAASQNGPVEAGVEDAITQIQDVMWKHLGPVRTPMGMKEAIKHLEGLLPKVSPRTRRVHEAANLHLAALLVARSALARQESRGAHYRIDFPARDDKKFQKHSLVQGETVKFV